MTEREKQIEELQNILISNGIFNNLVCRQDYAYPDALINDLCLETAETLYNANYRKMDETVIRIELKDKTPEEIKVIAEQFSTAFGRLPIPTLTYSNEEIKKQTAKKLLEQFADVPSYDYQPLKNFDFFKKLAKEYGVEID